LNSSALKFVGFLDTYYAYDFNRPQDLERSFTTQPARHNEANINLAYVGANYDNDKIRSNLILQYGTAVTKNTVDEPNVGATSGPDKNKLFQEAYIGKRLNENMWLDAGIYLGHIGMESWISKNNFTYTRSLMLDYVPYYSTGLRLTTKHSEKTQTQLHLMNGWQNVSENNQDKALGFQITHQLNDKITFAYNNFAGNEKRSSLDQSRLRTYNDFIFYFTFSEKWKFNYSVDIGTQGKSQGNGSDLWWATAGVLRYQFLPDQAIAFRAEYYNDRHQACVQTKSQYGFVVSGFSTNYDYEFEKNFLWRTEYRIFNSEDPIYPKKVGTSKTNSLLVSSFSFSF